MGKKDDNHARYSLTRVVVFMMLFLGVAMEDIGDSWALNCQPKSVQGTAAKEFCQPLGHEGTTLCMCHDGDATWPRCKRQTLLSGSEFEMCGVEAYTNCLIACGSFIETVICQDMNLVQCTVVASNLRSFVS